MRALAALMLMVLSSAAHAQEFVTLKGHGGPIMALAVGADGTVVSGSFDNAVGHWRDGVPTWHDGHAAAVTAVTLGPEGGIISGADDFAVLVWENGSPRELGRHAGKIASLDVSPDGRYVAAGSWDGSVTLWPLEDGRDPVPLPTAGAAVNAVAFDRNGALFVGTAAGDLLRYSADDRRPRPVVKHGFGINRIVLSDGWLAYGAVDGGTRIINAETGAQIADFTLDRRPILSLAVAGDEGLLAVGDGEGYIMVIDTDKMRIARDFRATRQGPVWALAFSPEGGTIYAGGLDDVVYGWPVDLLGEVGDQISGNRSFLRDAATMPNGERQFMRKCSICHSLDARPSRRAGPTLHGVFGRRAGTVAGYQYSDTLDVSDIIWNENTIDALFDEGPDHYIPGSKMPMQVIAAPRDRADMIAFLKQATTGE
ncbi:c-type cytochrome [Sulfitobacter sp. S190]|uniref:c-type cytochrome n=1 Tax=Sulfitobacter sp. S190 TaxID=2867022 RepID=UPI0021A5C2E7|nr:c-type cytochrome [Sulfitobacter sp. S190]UWR24334.1 c-type cytochrome [Sulfitobacter sp. S190]